MDSALGGDDDSVAAPFERFCDQALAHAVEPVAVRRVKEIDATVVRGLERGETVAFGYIGPS